MKEYFLKDICKLNSYKQVPASLIEELKCDSEEIALLPSSNDYGLFTSYELGNKYVCEGEVITIGRARYANIKYWNGKFISSNNIIIQSKDKNLVLTKYLYYYFLCNNKKVYIEKTTYPVFDKNHFNKLTILIPSIDGQAEIVAKLDLISEAIKCEENRIQLYEELISSKFIEMFGDPVLNPMGWEKCQLAEKCDISTGNTPSRKIPEYYGDYIEWIKSDNINTAFINLTEAVEYLSEKGLEKGRSVEVGSILMTCIAGSVKCIGNVGIADRKVAFNQQINGISPRNNNTYFMYEQFILDKQYIQSHIKMAVKGMLNKTQLSKIEFIFPPIEKQNKFGAFMEEVHSLIDDGYYQLEKLNELLATEMHKYFD